MKEEILELAQKLITYESVVTNPEKQKDCAQYIFNYLKDLDVETNIYEFNNKYSVVCLPKDNKNPEIILNGHFDVVPGETEQFTPYIKDGKLYGRGAMDMKSQVAAMMVLYKNLMTANPELSLGLMLVGDEELGGFHGTLRLFDELKLTPKFCIAGEPTDLRIGTEAKGILWLELETKGISSHAARPWLGDNAITKLSKCLNELTETFPVPEKESFVTTMNVGIISGGQAKNKVPDKAEASLDIRFIPSDTSEALLKKVKAICKKYDTTVSITEDEPAAYCSKDLKYIKTLETSIKEVTGIKAEFIKKHAASDMRHLSGKGLNGIVFGPDGGGTAHSINEWVSLKSLEDFYAILETYITKTLV
jgi:succinyl-diaminopimelate desuccinylase